MASSGLGPRPGQGGWRRRYVWSFSGYFTAHAVMRRPDVYHAGVIGPPVSDWRDYDTHYTER